MVWWHTFDFTLTRLFRGSGCLPLQEQVQLNEGCLFRLNIDSDWVETEVVAIECRLLNRALPEGGDALAPTEEGDVRSRDRTPEGDLKEVRGVPGGGMVVRFHYFTYDWSG